MAFPAWQKLLFGLGTPPNGLASDRLIPVGNRWADRMVSREEARYGIPAE